MRRRAFLAGAAALLAVRDALAQGRVRAGVASVRGEATINGQPARPGMAVRQGDTVATGAEAQITFAVDRNAMLVRERSTLSVLESGLRIASGAVLSVFGPGRKMDLRTPTSTIGIRGTAVYIEAEPERTYVCTCYGEAVLEPLADPAAREVVRTAHHEQPRYIMGGKVSPAPMKNHTDAELEMLEALVGREPPFSGKGFPRY